MNINENLYNVLNINKDATNEDIKKSFRKLALQWHPDKNKSSESFEKFNHIKIAYDILSNKESRMKYDALNDNQHTNFLKVICNFVKSMINPQNINKLINIICDNDIYMMNEIKNMNNIDVPDYNNLKIKIEQRLKNKIDLEYINNFMHTLLEENKLNNVNLEDVNLSVFFAPDEIIPEQNYQLININEVSDYSDKQRNTNTSNNTDINIYGEIKTTLDEIYKGITKDINVVRQIIENNNLIFKTYKYTIPLNDDQIILNNQGDEYYDETNNIKTGNLIIDIRCKKHLYFKRVNDFDILVS
jgi:DnaJ-class molecular chaperone